MPFRRHRVSFLRVLFLGSIALWFGCQDQTSSPPVRKRGPAGSLVAAITDGDFTRADRLLDGGADPNQVNRYGDSPLIWAVNRERPALVRRLIEAGAALDHRGSFGRTALHWSCRKITEEPMYRLLVDGGADIDVRDEVGETPLMAAVRAGYPAAVQFLLQRGAKTRLVNNRGKTALTLAVENRSQIMVETLIEGGAEPDEAVLRTAVNSNLVGLLKSEAVVAKQPHIGKRIDALYDEVETNPEGRGLIDIRALTPRVYELINLERTRRDLKPLTFDPLLARIAVAHSRDMGARDFFDHINPDGQDPTARACHAGFKTRGSIDERTYKVGVGENIHMRKAYSGSHITIDRGVRYISYQWLGQEELAKAAVKSWMDSPPHRENILNPIYETTGVGIAKTADDALYFTQVFW